MVALLKKNAPEGEPYDTEVLSQNGDGSSAIRSIERKSGPAATHTLARAAVRRRREYRSS